MATDITSVNSYFTGLISQMMSIQRQPLATLQTQRSDLTFKQAVFSDLSTKLSTFQTAINGFKSTALTSVFDKRSAVVSDVPSDKTVFTASASDGAVAGVYNLSVDADGLALEHRVRSDKQYYSDQALNLAGSFVLGGAAARSQAEVSTIADTVTAFGTAALQSGQTELGSGNYYVETRNDASAGWQFRLVDADGKAASIRSSSSSSYTSAWQSMPTGGGAYDTGRGLTLTFGADSGAYQAASKGAGAAQSTYTAQGATIEVTASTTLNDIATAINNATYADGNAVTATVVDKQLVLAAKETGTAHAITAANSTGTVLQSLGLFTAGGAFKNPLQTAQNASFTINGIPVTRSRNTGLDDVVTGVTLNLAADAAGQSATLSVGRDNASVKSSVQDLLSQFNGVTAYLQDKTSVTGTGNTSSTATYTRGVLADDYAYSGLRGDLLSDIGRGISGLPTGAPKTLSEIGITLNDSLQLTISDSSKFDTALTKNASGVKALLQAVSDRLDGRLDNFTNVNYGALALSQKSVANEIKDIDTKTVSLNEYLVDYEDSLKSQYAVFQSQVLNNLYLSQTLSSLSTSLYA